MRKISEKKHSEKKSAPAGRAASSQNILDKKTASALELMAFTNLDDAGLRRLANENCINPLTKRPWIPKPQKGIYAVSATLAGVSQWWHYQATRDATDHPIYADMSEAESRGLVPREFQKYAKSRGVDFINRNRSIKSEPLRRLAFEILRKVCTGPDLLEAIEDAEVLNPDAELAKLRREQRLEIARENAEAEGVIHNRARVEALLWEHGAGPLRAGLLSLRKTAFAQVDAELDKAEVAEPVRAIVKAILIGAIEKILADIRNGFPKHDPATKEKP